MKYRQESQIKSSILVFILFASAITIGYVVENTERSSDWQRYYISAVNQVISKDSIISVSDNKIISYKDSLSMIRISNKLFLDSIQRLNKRILNYKWQLVIKKDSSNVQN